MQCHEARAAIPKVVDGLLDFEEDFIVRQHISGCPACRAVFQAYERDEQALNQYIRQAPYAPVARGVTDEIERRRRPWWDAFRAGSYRLASVAGLVMVILVVAAGAWAVREVALTGTTDDDSDQMITTLTSPTERIASTEPELIGASDINYIIGKLDDAGLVSDVDAVSEGADYTIEYGRIAVDRRLTFIEYWAEAESDDVEVFINIQPDQGAATGAPIRFENGAADGWLVVSSAMRPDTSLLSIVDNHTGSESAQNTHELAVDFSSLPDYGESIEQYEASDANNGVELCCIEIERGVAISIISWDWQFQNTDDLIMVDETFEPVDEPPLPEAYASAGTVSPEVSLGGEEVRILDTSFYTGLRLDGMGVAAYGLPSEGPLTLHFQHIGLPTDGADGGPALFQGPWTLTTEIVSPDPAPEPTLEPTEPPYVAEEPTPTPEPEAEITPIPAEDDGEEDRLRVMVYMVHGEELRVSAREIPHTQQVATAAINALLEGPNDSDRDFGLHSQIPDGTELRDISIEDETLTVDLSAEFAEGSGSSTMLMRLAQIVHTGTQFGSIENVQILIEGEQFEALAGEGIIIDEPLDRADFEDQAPIILIETPAPGETVTGTVRLRGTSNTFEATLQVEIIGPDGEELYADHAMASSGTGTRGEFDLTIPIDLESEGWGTVRMFEYSARDGSRTNIVDIPVRFVLY